MSALTQQELRICYERYGPLVRRRCQTLLRNTALGEDACQNAFVKLLRYGAAYREADSQLGWLYRVADNCCFDLLRARRHQPIDDVPEAAAADPGHAAVEERDQALRLLQRFDEDLQQIAVLHYIDEPGGLPRKARTPTKCCPSTRQWMSS